jgi:branched-chain amino acid transport system substrate-binding protein
LVSGKNEEVAVTKTIFRKQKGIQMNRAVLAVRRVFSGFSCLLVFVFLLSAVPSALAKEPVKIGFMAPYVGVYTKLGKDMDNGFRLGLEEAGFKAGGRPIVMITEDTEGKPELGPTKARKLIENDKVDIIAGIIHSGVALSIRDIVTNAKIPTLITNAGAAELTGRLKSPYIFRASFATGQQDLAGGWYAYTKLGYRRMILIAPDYTAGHDRAEGFSKAFKAEGGEIVDVIYAPLTTTDFGPFLTKIAAKAKSVDAVWIFFTGSGGIRLINQYSEYGLKATTPLFLMGDTVDEVALPAMRDSALGAKNYLHYAHSLKNPENEKFVKAYLAKYKEYPGMFAEQGYVGAKVLVMALDAVKGNLENKEAFLAALRKVKFNAPRGVFRFDANQNVILPIYIGEVKKQDGRYTVVLTGETIPDVDQNWTPDKMKK